MTDAAFEADPVIGVACLTRFTSALECSSRGGVISDWLGGSAGLIVQADYGRFGIHPFDRGSGGREFDRVERSERNGQCNGGHGPPDYRLLSVLKCARATQYAIVLVAGLLAGLLLVMPGEWWRLGLGGVIGLSQQWIFRPTGGRLTLENAVATAALGVEAFNQLARWGFGPVQDVSAPPQPSATNRVVIVGGGFAGVSTARYLEQAVGADRSISLTLVSDTTALLFTPMLAEVAGSTLEPTHISSPLRSALRRTDVIRGHVDRIDLDQRLLEVTAEAGASVRTLAFDHLVLALGSVSNFLGLTGVPTPRSTSNRWPTRW